MSLSVVGGFQSQVKKLFKRDEILIDNYVFKLHSTYNFVIIVLGIIFITSNNYLNGQNITCVGGNSYVNNFCFLHGAAHIPSDIQGKLSPVTSRCTSKDDRTDEEAAKNPRLTNYYIWLPFILTMCAVIASLPELLWKNIFERGMMKKLVEDSDLERNEPMKKNANRFFKICVRNSWQAPYYNFGFAFCELLNVAAVVINRHIIDLLLRGQFSDYGNKASEYFAFKPDLENAPSDTGPPNPLCHVFPTEVSCSVHIGSITGGADKKNTLCLLSNNVFNQYYFLILWWWWVILLSVSSLAIIYRLSQLGIASVGMFRLNTIMNMLAVGEKSQIKMQSLKLGPTQIFLFSRFALNLKGSQLTQLIESIPEEKASCFHPEERKGVMELMTEDLNLVVE